MTVKSEKIDIAQLQKLEAQNRVLKESEVRIRAFAEALPQMAWISNRQGQLTYVNRRTYDYLQKPTDPRFGAIQLSEALHPEDLTRVLGHWTTCLDRGGDFEAEFRLRRHDGIFRWQLVRAIGVLEADGSIETWYGTNTDIHDKKLFEEELREAKDRAEDASRAKSAFLANMSHEIRTPLGAILGFTELLRDCHAPEDRAEYAEIISRNGKALTKIIDDILDLSKVEAGSVEIESIEFSVPEFVKDVADLFKEKLRAKRLDLQIDLLPGVPQHLESDPTRLRQILINLIGNAIKFSSEGSIRLRVEPVLDRTLFTHLNFYIEDTGVGMSEEQSQRLFQPFTQADSSMTRKFGGSGLGLFLSRRLAEALGGTIELVSSQIGVGSCFVVSIGARAISQSSAQNKDNAVSAAGRSVPKVVTARILLVEDPRDNQILLQRILTRAGMAIGIANDGEQGVQMARAQIRRRIDGYADADSRRLCRD
jgi:signal transduction histidine kinase